MALSLSFWLFFGSLFPKISMEELCKVPILFQHYIAQHADLSFFDYLKQHYGENNTHQNDTEHNQLPLHNHSHLCSGFLFTYFKFSYFLLENSFFVSNKTQKIVYFWENNYQFQPENSLFSPPKFIHHKV